VATPIRRSSVRLFLLVTLVLLSCQEQAPVGPVEGSRAISFESIDGVRLSGRVFGPDKGTAGVVLAHMFPADQRSWYAFAGRLADRGYRVLTFDFRGYCPGGDGGCSQGERDIAAIWQDVEGAVAELEREGASRIALIGASMGGTASLIAASHLGQDVAAVVTLSAPTGFEGLEADPEVLTQVPGAKLFIAGHADVTAATAVDRLYELTIQPKRPLILTTEDHGTDILTGNQAGIASTEILNWLEQYLPVSESSG